MGGCQSINFKNPDISLLNGTRGELHSFPSWCILNPKVESRHIVLVKNSWDRLINGKSNAFADAKAKDPTLTPIRFFYDAFYGAVFEWIPEVRPMFSHGMHIQGKMLANIMGTIVNSGAQTPEQEAKLKKDLKWLARTHNLRGIQQHWYNIFGLAMLHTIRKCTDSDFFTEEVRQSWIALYSRMMVIMIPEIVANKMPEVEDETLQAVFRKRGEEMSSKRVGVDSRTIHPHIQSSKVKPDPSNSKINMVVS